MFDWQKDLAELWASLTVELPEAIAQLADEVGSSLTEAVVEIVAAVTEEIELLGQELQELPGDWKDYDWLAGFGGSEAPAPDELELPASDEDWPVYYEPKRAATPDHQPACIGCRNYNGTTFGGNLLVCGFHPYGCQTATCPDWEAQ
jgi:hypothetical protein